MADPLVFPYRTEALGLPLLFAGQAQKEIFLNQAIKLLDALGPRAVEMALGNPPSEAAEGACFLVLDGATGDWSGKDRSIAVSIGGGWHFVPPLEGMQVFDRSLGCWLTFIVDWRQAGEPVAPQGGSVVDLEARAALAQLIDALRQVGVLRHAP